LSPLAEAGMLRLEELDFISNPVTDLSPLSRLPKLRSVNGEEYKRPRGKK
jgi:hypothetical protein